MSKQNLHDNSDDGDTQILQQISEPPPDANADADADADDDNGATVAQLNFVNDKSYTSNSLNILESDLRALHSKWQAVEKVIAERDERISGFEDELDKFKERCTTLETVIDTLTDDKNQLALELDSKVAELQHLNAQYNELTCLADDREKERRSTQRDNEGLEEDKRRLQSELSSQCRLIAETKKHAEQLDKQETELRVEIQELKDYIDARKGDWTRQNEKLQAYEETINGMSASLESHDDIVAMKESEKAQLACKVMDLERQLAETRGKYDEKETSYEHLQQNFETQAKELGNLSAATIQRNKEIEKLSKKVKRRDASIEKLQSQLKEGKSERRALEEHLSAEKDSVVDLQARLYTANNRVSDLEASRKQRDETAEELSATVGALRERLKASDPTIQEQQETIADLQESLLASEEREESLRDKVEQLTTRLDQMSHQVTEQEIKIAETDAAMLETKTELKNTEDELDAQRELVQTLEAELSQKQEDLDLLDRNVERLKAIGSDVRILDMHLGDIGNTKLKLARSNGDDSIDPAEDDDEYAANSAPREHQIVVENGLGSSTTRQVLTEGVSTIGRSKDSDIRVASKYISRTHARITVDGSSAVIDDAGSTNGFFVNSMQTRHHVLANGDVLEIGDCKFRYLYSASNAGSSEHDGARRSSEDAHRDGMH